MTENELIAEFMGAKATSKKGLTYTKDFLKYNTSWDWLMPVVERVKNMTPNLFNYNVKSMTEFRQWFGQIQSLSIFTPIDKVYAILINFIKWYNQTK